MRHWIVCRCFIVESQAGQLCVKAGMDLFFFIFLFFKDLTKPGHGVLLHGCPWRENCKFKLLMVKSLGKKKKNVFKLLVIWKDSFRTGGVGLLGCKPSSHEKERCKEPVLGRGQKERMNHSLIKWGKTMDPACYDQHAEEAFPRHNDFKTQNSPADFSPAISKCTQLIWPLSQLAILQNNPYNPLLLSHF